MTKNRPADLLSGEKYFVYRHFYLTYDNTKYFLSALESEYGMLDYATQRVKDLFINYWEHRISYSMLKKNVRSHLEKKRYRFYLNFRGLIGVRTVVHICNNQAQVDECQRDMENSEESYDSDKSVSVYELEDEDAYREFLSREEIRRLLYRNNGTICTDTRNSPL